MLEIIYKRTYQCVTLRNHNRSTASERSVIKSDNTAIMNNIDLFKKANDTELNDLGKIICLKISVFSVERISVFYVVEKLAEHGIHCLPCSYTNGVIVMFSLQIWRHVDV